jgi:hypothetical protein
MPGRAGPNGWKVIGRLLLIFCCILVPAALYWVLIGGNPIRCIYADPACSLAVSTYALVGATTLLFGGTLLVAFLALQQYEHDRNAALSMQRCPRIDKCTFSKIDAFLEDDVDLFQFGDPRTPQDSNWGVAMIDCASVGKAPVVAGWLRVSIAPAIHKDKTWIALQIGDLPPGERVHISLFFRRRTITDRTLTVSHTRHEGLGPRLRFYASSTDQKLVVKFVETRATTLGSLARPSPLSPPGGTESLAATVATASPPTQIGFPERPRGLSSPPYPSGSLLSPPSPEGSYESTTR